MKGNKSQSKLRERERERGDGVCRVNHGHEPHGVVCLGTIQGWRDKDNENDKKKIKRLKLAS